MIQVMSMCGNVIPYKVIPQNNETCRLPKDATQRDKDQIAAELCDTSTIGGCLNGAQSRMHETPQPGSHAQWICAKEDRGEAFCTKANENTGLQCGSTFLTCNKGNPAAMPSSNTHYKWNCVGSTQLIKCEEQLPLDKLTGCGNDVDTCITGYTPTDESDTSELHRWTCQSGSKSSLCAKGKAKTQVGLRCGLENHTCEDGDPTITDNDSNPNQRWHVWTCSDGNNTIPCRSCHISNHFGGPGGVCLPHCPQGSHTFNACIPEENPGYDITLIPNVTPRLCCTRTP